MKEWYTLKELIGIADLPSTPQGILLYAKKENWRRRRAPGVKGNVFEYYVYDMQEKIRVQLGVTQDSLEIEQLENNTQKKKEKALDSMLSEIKKILIKGMEFKELEKVTINKDEEILLKYYRDSPEKMKLAILNIVETMHKSNKG